MLKEQWRVLISVAAVVTLMACGSSTGSGSGGGAGGGAETASTSTAVENLENVSGSLAPASLDYTANSAAASLAKTANGDPCADSDGFLDCQPVLLQLYIELAEEILDMAVSVVDEVGTELGTLSDASGSLTVDTFDVEYTMTSATEFSMLMSQDGSSAAYVDVDGTTYTVMADIALMEEGEGESGVVSIVVDYTDADTWDAEIFIDAMECTAEDVRAPDKIKLLVGKGDGLWTGKAMLYSSLWRVDNDATCSETVTDDTTMNMFTDFVANAAAAKANVYMMDRSVDSIANIESFELSDYDDNYDDSFGDTSLFPNSFCNPASTLDAVWGDDCTDEDATVAGAEFGSSDDWVTPEVFAVQSVTLPTSL